MKRKYAILSGLAIAFIGLSVIAFLIWDGVFLLNNPSQQVYPIRGVDVSTYQGQIDWETLANQNISFAFIKATEGSTFVDERFEYNYENAIKTGLRIGAYHFFSYDSTGKEQAENFIKTVKKFDNMLPPVIDIEFYGDKENNLPKQPEVRKQLDVFIQEMESYYGMKPIIYATEKSYKLYIAGSYLEYDIWIRNVMSSPSLSDNREWTFWQYTNRETLKGYKGKEKYIDMNVFRGTIDDFNNYAK